jgi:hypothetical protein
VSTSPKDKLMKDFLCKAEWRSTALRFHVQAKNENQAWHKAWGQVARSQGGDDCLKVTILSQSNQ